MTTSIRTHSLTKYYGKTRGIEGLDLVVEPGEVFGYLGPNGAGKTTTIRLLLDLLRPTHGRVEVLDGAPSDPEVRRRIGYLPGELSLYRRMTAGSLLTLLGNLRGFETKVPAAELAERLDLDLTKPIGDLSRGNKQKVGLIQALMHEPDLLLLDEPTSGLDPLVQQEVYRILFEARDRGRTVFLSSHVLSEVERIADRVAIVRDGHLAVVEDMEGLKAMARRRIEFHFAKAPPAFVFRDIANVNDVTITDNVVTCSIVGSVDVLIKTAAQFEITTMISHEFDLEEVFLDYYRGDSSAE